jgi:hypothetical protein
MQAQSICSVTGCQRAVVVKVRGWCRMHYLRWWRYGNPTHTKPRSYPTTEEAFWARVVKTGDGCWQWTGVTNEWGYGRLVPPHNVLAHRFSWTLHFGAIPEGMLVCHTCDNPSCARPGHLFLGTVADNNRDRDAKGRAAKRYPMRKRVPGSTRWLREQRRALS